MKRLLLVAFLFQSLVFPAGAAELLIPGESPSSPGVFFPQAASLRLLAEVEQCRAEIPALRDLVAKDEELIQKLDGRVVELGKQNDDLKEMNKKAIKVADEARKSGPWYQRALSAGKWIAAGVILGFVAGAGR